jgi:PIN domain nuclease of toxin-antitoxin system
LIDTHVFIWLMNDPERVGKKSIEQLSTQKNQLYLSIASIWEIFIKVSLRKLKFETTHLEDAIKSAGIEVLNIKVLHCAGLTDLPLHHRDPFDRMLIAQATVENMALISADKYFKAYDVKLLSPLD